MANIDATTPSLRLVQKLSNAYASLDIAQVDALMSKNFTYKTFPQSHELPDETKDGFAKKYGGILALLEKVEPKFHEVIEAPGKVVLHATIVGTIAGEAKRLEYDSLIILSLVEEDGELKVLECKDFSDPQKRSDLHVWAAKALAK